MPANGPATTLPPATRSSSVPGRVERWYRRGKTARATRCRASITAAPSPVAARRSLPPLRLVGHRHQPEVARLHERAPALRHLDHGHVGAPGPVAAAWPVRADADHVSPRPQRAGGDLEVRGEPPLPHHRTRPRVVAGRG